MLTTCDLFVDAVHICTELGRVLETVRLSSLLIAPTMLEAAAAAGQAGSRETIVRAEASKQSRIILMSRWYLGVIYCNTHTHTPCHLRYLTCLGWKLASSLPDMQASVASHMARFQMEDMVQKGLRNGRDGLVLVLVWAFAVVGTLYTYLSQR